jgi:DNA-binding NtrC family response regulator
MRKVLVIDDEKATLTMFGLFLKAYGYAVLTAEDGVQGLSLLKAEAPPIVFTDLKMPGMDGFEVLRQIKRHRPATEVIVITGHGDMDLVIQALNLEATDFINKPVTRKALDAALKRAEARLENRHSQTALITLREKGPLARIDIGGTLGNASRPALKDAFQKVCGTKKTVVLNFEANAAVNGAGIDELVKWLAELRRRQTHTAISGLSDNFQTIFEMVGLGRYAVFFPTAEDAEKDFTRTPGT